MRVVFICLILVIIQSPVFSNSNGPQDGYAGDPPGNNTCVECHNSFRLNDGEGRLSIEGLSAEYELGDIYNLTINLEAPNASRWGFEITALTERELRGGNFILVNDRETQISGGGGQEPQYVKHLRQGTFAGNRSASWRVNWQAPEETTGTVIFYLAGNAADNNDSPAGDYIYAISQQINEAEPPPPDDVFNMELMAGWNLVSSPVAPNERAIETIFSPIVEAVLQVRSVDGSVYNPSEGINDIGNWNSMSSYQIKLSSDASVEFTGVLMPPQSEFTLQEGWNWIAYSRTDTLNPSQVFDQLSENVDLVVVDKDHKFYSHFGFNSLGMIYPGDGMRIYVTDEIGIGIQFMWEDVQGDVDDPYQWLDTEHYMVDTPNTGRSMSLLVTEWLWLGDFMPMDGDEIAVISEDGAIYGSAVIQGEIVPIILWGDDDTTQDEIEGFVENEQLSFMYWSPARQVEHSAAGISLNDLPVEYQTDGFIQIQLVEIIDSAPSENNEIPIGFELKSIYPNPFNSNAKITILVTETISLDLKLWNISGQQVSTLTNQQFSPGIYNIPIDGTGLAEGVYFVGRDGGEVLGKVLLLK